MIAGALAEPCPSDADLASFVEHSATPHEREVVEAHVDRCAACRQLLTGLAFTQPEAGDPADEHATEIFATARDRDRVPRGTLVGRFVVLEVAGAGGMGVVYTAYDPELDRKAALKLVRPAVAGEAARELLRGEAMAMARIQHPNVVTVHEVGMYRDQLFIAMERIGGSTLRAWLRGDHGWREALGVVIAAGDGLAAVHEAGIVHRDFKPENVLVGDDGRVKVTDFGLAAIDASASVAGGTPAYMPPEWRAGVRHGEPSGDQYSFCVTLDEALRGRLPRALRPVVRRGLAAAPAERYPALHALLADLRRRLVRRDRRRLGLAAATLLAIVAAASAYAGSAGDRADPCATAASRISGSWSPARAAAARTAFARSGLPFAALAADRATELVDRYAADWRAARIGACRDAREQSPALRDRRTACLDDLANRVRVVGDLLATADAPTVRRASMLVEALPSPESCSAGQLLAVTPLPTDPVQRGRIAAATDALGEAKGLFDAARPARAAGVVAAVAPLVTALDHAPLTAQYWFVAGQVAGWRGDIAEERRLLRKTAVEAEAAGLDPLRVRALLALAEIARGQRTDDAAEQLFETALGAIRRLGMPPELEAAVLDGRSRLAFDAGDFARALPLQERRVALEARRGDPVRTAQARLLLAATLKQLGRDAAAARIADEAIGVLDARLGAEHPDAADAHVTRAKLRYDARDPGAALPELELAYRRLVAALGDRHPDLVRAIVLRAEAATDLGRVDTAVALYREAATIAAEAFGSGSASEREQLNNVTLALLGAGRWQAGLETATRVLDLSDRMGDAAGLATGEAALYRGVASQALGQTRRAIESFERAIPILAHHLGDRDARVARAMHELAILRSTQKGR